MNSNPFDNYEDKLKTIIASDIMDKNIATVTSNSTIKNTIEILTVKKISAICVVDNNFKIIGVISEHDLLIQSASKDIKNKITYKDNVISVKDTSSLKEVLLTVLQKKLKMIPVINKYNQLVGYISRSQLLKVIVSNS